MPPGCPVLSVSTLHSQDHGHLNDPETEVTVTFPFIEQLIEVQGCFVTHQGSSAGGKPYTEPELIQSAS